MAYQLKEFLNTVVLGHVLELARQLADGCINLIVTSPPYYGLRDYQLAPVIWGGRPDCDHVWGDERIARNTSKQGGTPTLAGPREKRLNKKHHGQFCQHCGAWRGNLGLEPDPDLYIQHLVEVFRELRRVLHPTGVLWLNMGDAYASQGGPEPAQSKWQINGASNTQNNGQSRNPGNFKPKDLMGLPWRTALALQADGWWLRSAIPWIKANCLPESCKDRPTTAHEYWFMLTKSARYFWDPDAIRMPLAEESWGRMERKQNLIDRASIGAFGKQTENGVDQSHGYAGLALGRNGQTGYNPDGRNYRTTDLFFASLDAKIANAEAYAAHLRHVREHGGLLLDPDGEPVALNVPTKGFKGVPLLADYFDFDGQPYTLNPECPLHGGLPNDANPEQAAFWRFVQTATGDLEAAYQTYLEARPEQCTCEPVATDHFATFPAALIEPLLLGSTSAKGVCPICGSPWRRVVEKIKESRPVEERTGRTGHNGQPPQQSGWYWDGPTTKATGDWEPTCTCGSTTPAPPPPCTHAVVLDPFVGTGTLIEVAIKHGRYGIGFDLNPKYLAMARERTKAVQPLLPIE